MPTYVYGPDGEPQRQCDFCREGFELFQPMSAEALSCCPRCGAPVERIIQPVGLSGTGKIKKPSEGDLAKAGFTQYKRQGKGYYEKSFGQGPSALHP